MQRALSRRRFLARTALGGAGLLFLRESRLALGAEANSRLAVALIGVGGRGTWFVDTIPRMEQVVAVCDIDDGKLGACFKRWDELATKFAVSGDQWERAAAPAYRRLTESNVKTFDDFRKLFDTMRAGLDAAIVAIPDHTHAVASAAAIKAGKHVFCEKPLTRTVKESRALRELARTHKVTTSMGNQGTATGPFRRALELIRDGTLGAIKEVHVWNSDGGADRKEPPKGNPPVPAGFNWGLWLGPAAARPYHPEWIQRHLWREFGTHTLGNWGSHSANLAFMALKVDTLWKDASPPARTLRVTAKTATINRLSFPRWERVTWEIPAREEFPPIAITWHSGADLEGRALLESLVGDELDWGDKKAKKWNDYAGTIIVGAKGRIHATGHNATFRLLPAADFQHVATDRPRSVEESRGHENDFFLACRGGKPPWASFEYAAPLAEFLMLGNVATQFEETLEFDPLACKIVNNATADALLRAEYREGWTL